MKNKLWEFIDDNGTFYSESANQINTLYFPLCNTAPIMSSVSPDLHGDLKTDFNSFLLEPVSRLSLSNSRSSRNFWIYITLKKIWSATGVSKDIATIREDKFNLEAGLLWQKITRKNKKIGLKAEITSFVPASGEPVEIMYVEITNVSSADVKFIPFAAIPIFGRSARNLHDHRHVTSLLNCIQTEKFGIIVKPNLVFDETGHKKNMSSYFVFGTGQNYIAPQYTYSTQEEFRGENSDLEAPAAVFNNLLPFRKNNLQGKEAMGALRFKPRLLKPKESTFYIILMGIVNDKPEINTIFKKFNSGAKVKHALQETKTFWQENSCKIKTETNDKDFDNWFKWVNVQPVLRRTFGCSFLPDFDYGKGGRGWRDLWQDALGLILNNPKEARFLLVNNFAGVRIDGSNATIIGQRPEFIADRNNISRVWMDHGIWPLFTTHLYVHQTGDLGIFLEEVTYFRDDQLLRSREMDFGWKPQDGKVLKTKSNRIYKGSILEHVLVENLVQFFNVGPHNHIRLENADWNDGLDMAFDFGESVAFSAMYAQNLKSLVEIINQLDVRYISILKELFMLIDSITPKKINYSDANAKRKILDEYFKNTKFRVSGGKISLPKKEIIRDLKRKADWMMTHIRKNEWLKEGFFNGYYDNDKQRVEGDINGLLRMTLTGQVFPVMSGIATKEQTKILFRNTKKYLQDKMLKGFRLNTDFSHPSFKISGGIPPQAGKAEQLNLGRAFSFVYGDKENGAFFNHMSIMFAYALYKQGFANEGYAVINSIYKMAVNTAESKIYPGIPEYFNAQGQGMYSYLTGSASWFILTFVTEVFGIKGEYGNFVIEPKVTAHQFKDSDTISIDLKFANKKIKVRLISLRKKRFDNYSICKVSFNGQVIAESLKEPRFVIPRNRFVSLCRQNINHIEIILK